MARKENSLQEAVHKYIFICGLHRSGTSLVHRILSASDEFSGFENTGVPEDEGQHLQSVMSRAYQHGGPGRFAFDVQAQLTEYSDLLSKSEVLRGEWNQHWDLEKKCLIEKSPINLIRTRFLQEVFPNSYFIIIKRHPLAVSLATKKWSKTSVHELMDHWLTAYDIFQHDSDRIARSLVVKYEDLMSNSVAQLSRISQFLGVDLVLPSSIRINPKVNERYFRDWKRKFNLERKFGSKKILADFRERILIHGYDIRDQI